MPRDAEGNIADMIMHPGATFNRMNLGRFYEQYVNATSRDLVKKMAAAFGIKPFTPCDAQVLEVSRTRPELFQHWVARLMNYYHIINPDMPKLLQVEGFDMVKHIAYVMRNKIHLYCPTDNDRQFRDMVTMIRDQGYRPVRGPVTYVGNSGNVVVTKKPVLIGEVYITLLEKTGDEWTSVSSGKWQNFGVLAHLSKQDKYSTPIRNQTIRALGETELRIIMAYLGSLYAAEMLDRNGNLRTHEEIVRAVLRAPVPSHITEIVDRDRNPLGNARALQLVKHLALCGGFKFVYRPHSEQGEPDETGIKAYLGKIAI